MGHAGTEVRPFRLPNAVRRLRDEHEWSVNELARRAGVGVATIKRIEAGKHLPHSAAMLRLAAAFGLPLGDVFWSADDGCAA
jgi:transcriptional regulator with XRE-family HTH domain